jgi:hypothetical protein
MRTKSGLAMITKPYWKEPMLCVANPASKKPAQERSSRAADGRRRLSQSGKTGIFPAEGNLASRPAPRCNESSRRPFLGVGWGITETGGGPSGLIAFLIPKSKIRRLTVRSLPSRSRQPAPEGRIAAQDACANPAAGKGVFLPAARHVRAWAKARPRRANCHLRASPGSPRARPCREPAVAIPFSKTKGFFPLTDVHGRRENSVPTCNRGNCVPSSNWFAEPGSLPSGGP